MFSTYGRVLSQPGTLAFSAAGLVARIPLAMIGLGIVLLVEHATGSYGRAGAVSAAYVSAGAVAALVLGRLVDRIGQTVVLPVAVTGQAVSLWLLIQSVERDWSTWTMFASAALAGAFLPPIGAAVRTRWSHTLTESSQVQTAIALESVLDEVCFIVGPVVVTALATSVSPRAGLVAAIVTGLIGTYALASQRRTAPPYGAAHGEASRGPMPWATLVPILVVCVALGSLFGSMEVLTVAFADERGRPAAAGWLLALWSLGSLVAGLATGMIAWRVSTATRIRWGAAAMALTMVPLAWVDHLAAMGALLLVAGLAIAPTLIATISAVEVCVPRSRLTEGMALVSTAIVAGLAPGAALAGMMTDLHGVAGGYLVPVVAGFLGTCAALLVRVHYPADHGE